MSNTDTKPEVKGNEPIDLTKILTEVKTIKRTRWVEWEFGIELQLQYLNNATKEMIINRNTDLKFDKTVRQRVPRLNAEKTKEDIYRNAVVGWKGVTLKSLRNITPLPSGMNEKHPSWETEIPFSHEQLLSLTLAAPDLDDFIQNTCVNASMFQDDEREKDLSENLPSGQSGT